MNKDNKTVVRNAEQLHCPSFHTLAFCEEMSYMIETYYSAPADLNKEKEIERSVSNKGGKITFREEDQGTVVLTIEFDLLANANESISELKKSDIHVEGPCSY